MKQITKEWSTPRITGIQKMNAATFSPTFGTADGLGAPAGTPNYIFSS